MCVYVLNSSCYDKILKALVFRLTVITAIRVWKLRRNKALNQWVYLILSLRLIAKATPLTPVMLSAAKHLTEHKDSFSFMVPVLNLFQHLILP
jgi:hypothetical protein